MVKDVSLVEIDNACAQDAIQLQSGQTSESNERQIEQNEAKSSQNTSEWIKG